MCRQFPGFYLILPLTDSQEREPKKNTTSGRLLIRFGPFSNIFPSPLPLDVDYVVLKM
jgi:hypothetical protein